MSHLSGSLLDKELVSDFQYDNFCSLEEEKPGVNSNLYVKNLLSTADLFILQEGWVQAKYEKSKAVGLFHMFFTRQ